MEKERLENLKKEMIQEYADNIRNNILLSGAVPDFGIIETVSEKDLGSLSEEEFNHEMESFFGKLSDSVSKMKERMRMLSEFGTNFVFDSSLGSVLAKHKEELEKLDPKEREKFINSVEAAALQQIRGEIKNGGNALN